MTKDELKDELKDRISMALKDPVLQQGFEVICKENADLNDRLKVWFDAAEIRLANWQKSNKQLNKAKKIINEYLVWANWEGSNCPSFESICRKAEQFLKEDFRS